MAESLKNKVAIVVGASSGMGRATAALLAARGARVTAAARRGDRLEQLQQELETAGTPIAVQTADVTEEASVASLMESVLSREGRIDLVVYATGTNLPERSLEVLSPAGWSRLLETNLTGAFLCTRAVLPAMRAAGGGLIIYLSSAAVQMPDVSGVAYQASKHGLSGLAHGTRIEERSAGIRTCVIFPGLCDTEILHQRPVPTPTDVLARSLDPEDVAEAVAFVASLHPRAVVPELQLLPSQL